MGTRFLLDEHIEPQVDDRLESHGHDVESVQDAVDLGPGSEDTTLASYSRRRSRVILTYDNDFLLEYTREDYHAIIFFENDSLPPKKVADIAHNIAESYPSPAAIGIEFGTLRWL